MIAEQLKKAVLQAATQGKLTEQLPEDGDARDLLKEIQAEKARLVKTGKNKKEKPLPKITEDEIPFEIPDNWPWVRLGEVVDVKGGKRIPVGKTLTKNNTGHKYIRVADMHDGTVQNNDLHYVPPDVFPLIRNYTISSADVYITVAGSIGRVGSVPEEFDNANLTENADKLIFNVLDKNWLVKTLQSPFVQTQITEITTKVGQPKLAIMRIEKLVVPLATISEQLRIDDTVNSVLLEIQKLAEDENKLDELENAFPKKMKDAILQYAIQGKLTEQLPDDGNARELLTDIQSEKARLVKAGEIKKEKALTEITEDENPFEIPENWVWARLGNVILAGRSGGTPDTKTTRYYGGGIPFVTIKDMTMAGMYLENTITNITDLGLQNSSAWIINPNHILYSMYASIGKVSINKVPLATSQAIIALRLIDNLTFRLYVYTFLRSMESKVYEHAAGTTQLNINAKIVKELLIPIPPLAEQKRIVDRLEVLMPLCDTLE